MTPRRLLWAAVLTLTMTPGAMAQSRATTADLTGNVFDQTNAALPGATVTATNTATNAVRITVTDGQGRFTIPALPPGTYAVTCELTGFTTERSEQVTLSLGEWRVLEFALRVAGATEQVSVSAQAPLVDIQNTAVSNVVSQDQIQSLPINGRNFISFSIITPGVTVDQTPQQGASATSGLTFAGQRARSNNITVDGLDNNDITLGSVRATFSQEAVREFQVITNSYSAEFGKASGGVVNIVTKSGTNAMTGNLFGFFRDDGLNAKNYFEKFDPAGNALNQEKAPYSHKQWGGTIGGPLVKNKTFYFASFERLDVEANNFVNIENTTAVRHPITGAALGTPLQIINNAGFPVADGNQPYALVTDSFLVKADHETRSGQSLAIRYNYGDNLNENIEPFGGQVARSRGAYLDSSDNMLAASHTGIFRGRWVNEVRFQYARRVQDVISLDPRCNGICDQENEGGPTLEIIGVASVGRQRFTPTPRTNDRYQFLDTLSVFKGSHQLKGGIDFNIVKHTHQALPLHFGGRYIFVAYSALQAQAILGASIPISSIQAVALGLPARYVQGYGPSGTEYGYHDVSLFAQDDWQVSNRLTLKLGLRYQNQIWPGELTYQVAGYPGAYSFPSDGNNLAPRIAAAWDPTGNGRTSVHASYGMFYDNHITSMAGIASGINGDTGVRTLVAGPPTSFGAWALVPNRQLPASAVPPFPSLEISIDPGLKTPWAHHTSIGINRELPGDIRLSADYVNVRGYNQVGTIDYNPVVTSLGSGRRPEDVNNVANTSASILQYTSWGHTWYDGFTLALTKRFNNGYQFLASYTLSKAEDESTDFQSAFVPQNNGQGRNDADPNGLPIGFSASDERGPSLQDQRNRFVLSGLYVAPKGIRVSSIITVASGRPYNILAGTDLNGDGDGGAFPPDRARQDPTTQASSVERNSGTMPSGASVDVRVSREFPIGSRAKIEGLFEVFNLFNRTNYTEINNIFGTGAYPASPLPTYGQFTQAAPPRQVQLAFKLTF
jgi:Carboxypeptidase regulatory-like domain/TonB dependent receptor-like, beta-barrel